ncbi:MAG: ATP-binding protein [Clostridiales bacterium]|nr:ATP-binding protein [Clostridiales bacterium]
MQRIFGDRKKINLGSSEFRKFIESGYLYVDKTRFIEHVLDDASDVLLFTRPRRTGKSLNLDMLRTFLDCKLDTRKLFEGLYIKGSGVFANLNKHPVAHLSLKELDRDTYKSRLFDSIETVAYASLSEQQMGRPLRRYFDDRDYSNATALRRLIEDIHAAYGRKPYVLVDEYDKILTDNVGRPEYEEIREWLTKVFESAFKDNHALGKAVVTGVTRVSQESLFSGLNNIEVYDVFRQSVFDGDFSLTEEEAVELLDEGQLAVARKWYNNYRVGDEKLYTMYSVMSYLKSGRLENYWGQSGTMNLLVDFLDRQRMQNLVELFSSENKLTTPVERRLSYQLLSSGATDAMYYSLAVQAGYLSHDALPQEGGATQLYQVYLHNEELRSVWGGHILTHTLRDYGNEIQTVFSAIAQTEEFSRRFEDYISFRLSYFDLKADLEWVYHVLTLGFMLGAGFKCSSNKESGYGRYDLLVEGEGFAAILEFKAAKTKRGLAKEAKDALAQIDERQYFAALTRGTDNALAQSPTALPIYKVGIACYKTACHVETVLHPS